jgi:hypothetical protein
MDEVLSDLLGHWEAGRSTSVGTVIATFNSAPAARWRVHARYS